MTQLEKAKEVAQILAHLPIQETEFSPIVIMHPFFESALLPDMNSEYSVFNALEEPEKYQIFLKDFCKNRIQTCNSIESILCLVRKSYKLTYLKFLKQENIISLKECGNLLANIWTEIEVINHDANVPKQQVLNWIAKADKNILMNKDDTKIFNDLPDEVTVYRGCEDKTETNGISWTLNKAKAEWFANRWSKQGICFKAKIKKEYIIGYTDSRGEKEIILDYRYLTNITEC